MSRTSPPHAVLVIANLPVSRDRRVSRQARTLVAAGWQVTVVCPAVADGPDALPGAPQIRVAPYRLPVQGNGLIGYLVEFLWSFVAVTVWLLRIRRSGRIDLVQFCNPPDIFFPLAFVARKAGIAAVFDHHDLSPEMYKVRTGRPRGAILSLLQFLEHMSITTASAVVATNESFRDRALVHSPARVVVVRNGPSLDEVPAAATSANAPARPRVGYLGVLGPSDGVESFVQMAALVRRTRPDADFVVAGDGPELEALRRSADSLGLGAAMRFTGWLTSDEVHHELRDWTVAVQPDPRNEMNEQLTMAKTVEYMAHGLPIVAVDMIETRRSAGESARYVQDARPHLMAEAVLDLLEQPELRLRMAQVGRDRVRSSLAWDHQGARYTELFERLVNQRRRPVGARAVKG
ncbi:MAG: hypothetical protein QOJ90_376 [Actinomycetota bacterium]|jgi:glycosyltransferase involved in cell wall biosynthesis|nr:hypothetical protein [Actinomycetota bacterium]MDQ1641025.1 hypothetical protein [Actinomycetota bacterium]